MFPSSTATTGIVLPGSPFKIEMTLPPGPLDATVETSSIGGYCVVREKLTKQSKLAVGDSIISVNGIDFDGMAKMEEGVRAWLHLLFQEHNERILVVVRSDTDTTANTGDAPLKSLRTSNIQFLKEARLAAGCLFALQSSVSSKTSKITWKDETLLREVALHWTVGEGKRQNSQCLDAIQSCLLNDISPLEVATLAGNANIRFGQKGQEMEFKRAHECAKRISKSTEKQRKDERDQLLSAVASNWTTGKACPQTSECKAAIRKCLLAGISTDLLGSYVAKQFNFKDDDEARELKRVQGCTKRIKTTIATETRTQGCGQPIISIIKQPWRKEEGVPVVEIEERTLIFNLSSEFDKE
jgi:hypothetical protein